MSIAVDHLDYADAWPTVALLQNDMVENHDRSDARREASRLPASLGRLDEEDRVVLTLAGIYRAEPNHTIVDDFERALKLVSQKYRRRRDRRTEATVSVEDLVECLSFTEVQARRTLILLESERLVTVSGEAKFVIEPEIHHFLYVRNAKGYVRTKAKRDRQRCIARKREAVAGATIGDRGGIRKIVLTVLATVLAAFVLWIGHQLWPADEEAPEQHRKSNAVQRRTQVGAALLGESRRLLVRAGPLAGPPRRARAGRC